MLPNYALGALDALNATVGKGAGAGARVVEDKVVAVEAEAVAVAVAGFLVSNRRHHSQQDVHRMTCIP